PLPAGRLDPQLALRLGLVLAAVSVPLLTFAVGPLPGLLAAVALVSYVLLYTPLKRHTAAALLVGAVPGAIPPLIGWTAATALLAGLLFLGYGIKGLRAGADERWARNEFLFSLAYLTVLFAVLMLDRAPRI